MLYRLGLVFGLLIGAWSLLAVARADGVAVPGIPPNSPGAAYSYPPVSSGGGYSGPCDTIPGATAFFGFLSCSAAYATAHNPAADICDVNTCTLTTTINSCSGLSKLAVGPARYETATLSTVNQPYSFVVAAERTGSVTTQQYAIGAGAGGGVGLGWTGTANTATFYASGSLTLGSVADSSFHALIGVGNGASSTLNADGSSTNGNAGTSNFTVITYGTDNFGDDFLAGYIVAGGVWPSAINVSTMNSKLHSLCGGF